MTYQEAEAYLKGGRDKRSRPLENNTRLERREDGIAVRLHGTDVVTFYPDGRVKLDSGGWRTVTTKDRMGYAPGWCVYQRKFQWYVHWHKDKWPEGTEQAFSDGMILHPDGRVEAGE